MKLKNETKLTLGFAVGIVANREPTVTGLLKPNDTVELPDEEVLIIKNATLKS